MNCHVNVTDIKSFNVVGPLNRMAARAVIEGYVNAFCASDLCRKRNRFKRIRHFAWLE